MQAEQAVQVAAGIVVCVDVASNGVQSTGSMDCFESMVDNESMASYSKKSAVQLGKQVDH